MHPFLSSNAWRRRHGTLLLLSSLTLSAAHAQFDGEHALFYNAYDQKHYAVAAIEGRDEYLMAGTVFNYAGAANNNAVHWLHFDNIGNLVAAKVVDDPDYDQRPVGVHLFNGNSVTVAGREGLTGGPNGIEVITQDLAGNLMMSTVINSADPSYPSMYPLSSLKYSDAELFICGYVTNGGPGSTPDLSTPKEGFVLKFDVNANAVIDVHYFSSPVISSYDYDMATRMKTVSSGIWVGGSVNGGPMMNRVIDPATLNDIYAVHFGVPYPYGYESSFDVAEDLSTGNLYVFGNVYAHYTLPQPSAMPMFVHITGVNNALVPYPGNSRWQFNSYDYAWGINVLPDASADQNVILNGFTSNRRCNSFPATSMNNINPFLAMLQLSMAGGTINVNPVFWNTILSFNGTGSSSLTNSYFSLGGYRSNNAWTPVTAVRDYSVTKDIVLSAPVWNTAANTLNMKFVRTTDKGEVTGCLWTNDCGISSFLRPVGIGGPQSNMPFPFYQSGASYSVNDFFPDYDGNCFNGVYKPTGIDEAKAAVTATLYPNPATQVIHLEWQQAYGQARLSIVDVMGRTVLQQTIGHEGHATVPVGQLAPGAYHYTLQFDHTRAKGIFVKQ
ncbi:T9SS type A sorting domain-containing protein [Taibaiella koreensis]|uniref:T9SS type A sorting domain-containing protein n=1 Tax=Taibaiella koreensis TaxID=1268548 RepID=UPI0013C2B734|nr:T9SS type A sorting domain-containing protein [Taibaiella koreensis]